MYCVKVSVKKRAPEKNSLIEEESKNHIGNQHLELVDSEIGNRQ